MVKDKTKEDMNMEKATATFTTLNQYLATYLVLLGWSYDFVRSSNGRLMFAFPESKELRDAVRDFMDNKPVPVNTFSELIRQTKTDLLNRIHST